MPMGYTTNARGNRIITRSDEPLPDELRCTAMSTQYGRRCNNHRVRGTNKCAFHAKQCSLHKSNLHRFKRFMPKFYAKYVTKSLGQVLDEALNRNPVEQLELLEELALMRDVAGQAVLYYSIAKDAIDAPNITDAQKQTRQQILFAAGEILRERVEAVCGVAEKAQRITTNSKDRLQVQQLQYFIEQVTICLHKTFGDDKRIEQFHEFLMQSVRIPQIGSDGTEGTILTPDQDVSQMDSTIPKQELIVIPKCS